MDSNRNGANGLDEAPMTLGPRVQRQLERLLDECEAALEARDWPRVEELAADALRLHAEDPDARGFLEAAQRAPHEAAGRAAGSDRGRVLAEMMRIATSSIDQSDLHARVFAQIERLLDFDMLHVAISPEGTDYIESYATAGKDAHPEEMPRMPLDDGPWGEVIRENRAVFVPDFAQCQYPHMQEMAAEANYRSGVMVPMRSRGRVIGMLALGSTELDAFHEADREAAQDVADHLAVIVEHTWLFKASKERGALEERERLAREIHDSLGQTLAGVVIQLETLEQRLESEGGEAFAEAVQGARDQARESLEEARRSIWDLQPAALEAGGLVGALERVAQRAEQAGLDVSLRVEGAPGPQVDRGMEQALYRIAQESVSNLLQHAQAEIATICLEVAPTEVRLRVSDAGVGFDPNAGGRGFGLTSIQERARLLDGRVEFRSTPGVGTEVVVVLPIPGAAQQAPSTSDRGDEAEPSNGAQQQIRVLIVDDHELVRRGIRQMLSPRNGVEVIGEAEDGQAAVREIRSLRPDVMLLDVQMPELDGVETLRRLREEGLETRTILLSVFAKDEQILAGLRAGASGYLMKDARPEDLLQAIRTVHAGGSLIPPVIANRLVASLESPLPDLTEREAEVLELLASGARNKEIAADLSLSAGTVKWHISNVFQKLDVTTRTEGGPRHPVAQGDAVGGPGRPGPRHPVAQGDAVGGRPRRRCRRSPKATL